MFTDFRKRSDTFTELPSIPEVPGDTDPEQCENLLLLGSDPSLTSGNQSETEEESGRRSRERQGAGTRQRHRAGNAHRKVSNEDLIRNVSFLNIELEDS